MKRLFRTLFGIGMVLFLSACATGPKYEDAKSGFPALDADKGRIFFYREAVFFGDAVQPDIKLNGQVVGQAQPNGVFFVDRPPGDFEVLTSTEVDEKLTFTLDRGEIRYVKLSIQMGILIGRIVPKLVGKEEGQKEIQGMSYTGGGI